MTSSNLDVVAPILLELEVVKPLPETFSPTPARVIVPPGLAIGTRLGHWVIERELGAGSMGQVYGATHERLGRRVALKVLRSELVDEEGLVERFLQEGRAVNQINHEHIVEVHDFVHEQGTVYCVMEFLEGETLASRLARRPTSIESIRSMGRQIASALGASHAAGVVHRDLKPENIFLVSRDGRDDWVKVIDFGIAKCAAPDGGLSTVHTAQGSVLGTPRYMAPEQVAGLPVDGRTDIYALGTILHELISGNTPFDGPSFGMIAAAVINDAPPPLPRWTAAGEEVPGDLAALIAVCLSKQPAHRPASMGDVEATLAQTRAPGSPRMVRRHHLALLISLGLFPVGLALSGPPPEASAALVVGSEAGPERSGGTWAKRPHQLGSEAGPERSGGTSAQPPQQPEVTLWVGTEPPGALVSRLDSGAPLGLTPLEVRLERAAATVSLRIALAGHEPLERAVSIDESQRLEYMLQALPKTKPVRASRAAVFVGVIDPY